MYCRNVHAIVINQFQLNSRPILQYHDIGWLYIAVSYSLLFQIMPQIFYLMLQCLDKWNVLILLFDKFSQRDAVDPIHFDNGVSILLNTDAIFLKFKWNKII